MTIAEAGSLLILKSHAGRDMDRRRDLRGCGRISDGKRDRPRANRPFAGATNMERDPLLEHAFARVIWLTGPAVAFG